MNGPPAPGRYRGEPDGSYEKYRAFARAGGYQDDGTFSHRPTLREFAETIGITHTWVRRLSSKWEWMQRVEAYDSAMASWVARQETTAGAWANLTNRLVDSLGDVDPSELKTGDRVMLLKLANDRLEAVREREELRPIVLGGLTLEHIKSRLAPDEYDEFQRLLRKLK